MNISPKKVVSNMNALNNHLIVGIGNMVGWGEKFIQDLRKYKI